MKIGREAHPNPVENYFEESFNLGFNWLELGCESPVNFPQTFDEARIRLIRDLGRKYGISCCLHSASYVNTAEIMPTVRKAVEQHLIEYLSLAKRMECTYLVIHCGYHFSQFMEATYEALLTTLKNVVKEAEKLNMPLAFVEKRRTGNRDQSQVMSLIGDVSGMDVIIIDDECDTAGSMENAVYTVRDHGARDVYIAFSHAVLSDHAVERLERLEVKEIITTDTLPIPEDKKLPNMRILSVAPLIAEVILRAHEGRSVGELFNE